jgi:hypothetical protein
MKICVNNYVLKHATLMQVDTGITCTYCLQITRKKAMMRKNRGEVKTVKTKIRKDFRELENNEKVDKVKIIVTEKERGGGRES